MIFTRSKYNAHTSLLLETHGNPQHHIMMTSSNGNIFRVTGPLCGEFTGSGEFPTQRPVTRSFDVFFDLRLNKRLSKQPWGWWFETLLWSLWRQCNDGSPKCCKICNRYVNRNLPHNSDDFDFQIKAPFINAILDTAMPRTWAEHLYSDVKMSSMVSRIAGISKVYSTVCSGADQRKYQNFSIWWRHQANHLDLQVATKTMPQRQ